MRQSRGAHLNQSFGKMAYYSFFNKELVLFVEEMLEVGCIAPSTLFWN